MTSADPERGTKQAPGRSLDFPGYRDGRDEIDRIFGEDTYSPNAPDEARREVPDGREPGKDYPPGNPVEWRRWARLASAKITGNRLRRRNAFLVLSLLAGCCGRPHGHPEYGQWRLSYEGIAFATGISTVTVGRILAALESAGVIRIKRGAYRTKKGRVCNVYTLAPAWIFPAESTKACAAYEQKLSTSEMTRSNFSSGKVTSGQATRSNFSSGKVTCNNLSSSNNSPGRDYKKYKKFVELCRSTLAIEKPGYLVSMAIKRKVDPTKARYFAELAKSDHLRGGKAYNAIKRHIEKARIPA